MADITVIIDAVRAEAKKWHEMSDQVAAGQRAADRLELGWTAFFIGDVNAELHADTYRAFQSAMARLLGEAAVEFGQVAAALGRVADAYDQADREVALDLDQVYKA